MAHPHTSSPATRLAFLALIGAILAGALVILRANVLVPEVWEARFFPGRSLTGSATLAGFPRLMFYNSVPAPEAMGQTDYAAAFSSCLELAEPSVAQFELGSGEGSRLRIDGAVLIDLRKVHQNRASSAHLALPAGVHPVAVEYYHRGTYSSLFFKLRLMQKGPMLLGSPLLHKPTFNSNGEAQCTP